MEERLTYQPPGTVLPSPEIPSSPAALFEPMAPAVREPAMAAASVPPSTPVEGQSRPARRWPMLLAIGVVALFLGAAAGYFAGSPARDDLQSQRDDARAQVGTLTQQLDTSRADLASATDQLTTATEGLASAQADLTKSEAELASLSGERDQLVANAEAAVVAARAGAYISLNFNATYAEAMAQSDPEFVTSYNELLALLGEDMTLTEWVGGSTGFLAAERAVYATEDTPLIDAWNTWTSAESGTVEERVAWEMIMGRLDFLTLTTIDAG